MYQCKRSEWREMPIFRYYQEKRGFLYTKTDLVFAFTRPRQNEYLVGDRMTGRAGWKPNLVTCPTCRSGGQLSPDRKHRGLYSLN
ncbi:MAG: hypothetical protein D8M57_10225 [Candidatus Scalindua sp. AMX11]|nr:MAG: hypothetical protein DWQ00_01360 [Candidatus Scalindua sp.]TDE64966.1 MAG: hypothetical protein D8M57_10225 [Candidatus Scalindua sp. AMX11]